MNKFWRNNKFLVTGGGGFLGKHVVLEMQRKGVLEKNIIIPRSKDTDLRKISNVKRILRGIDIVIHLAANVGGIGYNREYPAEIFYDNAIMGIQLLHESWRNNVKKFVALGTICCYPKLTPIPFREKDLWNGYPEETNAPYGLAKKMILVQSQAYRTQYNFNSIFLLPVNLYGPGDNFNPRSSHVIPALIKKFWDAKRNGAKSVNVWGSGKATREFLYVKDAARAIVMATEMYNKPDPINIGAGFEISIKDLANKIKNIIRFKGKLTWDTSKPDGQPRRMLKTSKAYKEFGFKAKINFDVGLKKTIHWYEQRMALKRQII